jgi:poly-beta-1,6-N-acetyl-D-glucosamine synthase
MRLVFWISIALIAYVYVGYPLLLAAASAWRKRLPHDETHQPPVSLVIAAFNEERIIRAKLDNALSLAYPPAKLEIVVVSDGSSDRTDMIVSEYASRGVVLHRVTPRGGKTRALNLAVPRTTGSILVLSDANTMFRPDAVTKLVRHFVNLEVGGVSGDVRLVDSAESYAASEGLYYRYERQVQRMESRLDSIIGADGGMYAIRRDLFRPPPSTVVVDDFVISMTVARLGYRVLYDQDAVAIEQGTLSVREEFRRKVRIVAGGFQALILRQGVPRASQGLLMWCYVSHKLLRWLVPVFLAVALVTSAMLAAEPLYAVALVAQLAAYAAGLAHAVDMPFLRRIPGVAVAYYFCMVNGAALTGLWKGLARAQPAAWNRTSR